MVTGTETGRKRARWCGWNGTGNDGVGGVTGGAGIGVRRPKMSTLVGDVSEYRNFYKGEGAD